MEDAKNAEQGTLTLTLTLNKIIIPVNPNPNDPKKLLLLYGW